MYAAKAVYAVVMAAITAALGLYDQATWLVILAAALTPLGVYLVPNTPSTNTVQTQIAKSPGPPAKGGRGRLLFKHATQGEQAPRCIDP